MIMCDKTITVMEYFPMFGSAELIVLVYDYGIYVMLLEITEDLMATGPTW